MSFVERIDRFQRNHPRAGLPIAVLYKYADDQGSYLAALIAYYGFVSIVPLLLLSSTILGFVLHGNPALQSDLLNSALGQFPVVGPQLAHEHGITGSGFALVIGILGTLYGGLGSAQAAQNAMNTIWRVPRNSRPNPLKSRLRSLLLLAVVGLSVLGTTGLAALGSVVDVFGVGTKVLIGILTLAVNTAVFTLGFRVATARDLSIRETVPGAAFAAICWQALQYVGAIYVGHTVARASEVNAVFALVLGLVAWLYVEAVVVVFAAEYNTVRSLQLYPRALLTPFTDDVDLTRADVQTYSEQAKAQRAKGFERISVRFHPPSE
jgi:YihY family inner membrane protein